MKPPSFMLIAGEPSGDTLAAELVGTLRDRVIEAGSLPTADAQPLHTALVPRFFGAGGPRMANAGVELAFDLTQHSVIGLSDVLKHFFTFRRFFNQLLSLALDRQPDVIIGVDYGGFNLRFARAIRRAARARRGTFGNWNPRLVQFVSPQVWASRPERAFQIAENYDLLLSIFPFEKAWYAKRVPKLKVEFVGHPLVDRYREFNSADARAGVQRPESKVQNQRSGGSVAGPRVLLLPGSRTAEVRRHLPVMLEALKRIRARHPAVQACMVLPTESLAQQANSLGVPTLLDVQIGGLPAALAQADLALASTGTVTMECACFGVPTVTFYKTSWSTYQIARRIVTVNSLTMPNLLANEVIFPEFIQNDATPENIATAALKFLDDEQRRTETKTKLAKVVASIGSPGATRRAAHAIVQLI
jgi:lipid-A-disaccharide synthase